MGILYPIYWKMSFEIQNDYNKYHGIVMLVFAWIGHTCSIANNHLDFDIVKSLKPSDFRFNIYLLYKYYVVSVHLQYFKLRAILKG